MGLSSTVLVSQRMIFSLPLASQWLVQVHAHIFKYAFKMLTHCKVFFLLRPGVLTVAEKRGCSSIFFPGAIFSLLINDKSLALVGSTEQAALQVKRSFSNEALIWGKQLCKPGLSLLITFCNLVSRERAVCK